MGQVGILRQLIAALLPLGNLVHTAAGIFIQRDIEAVDQLRILVLDEIGQILRVMLAGLGHIIAEALHDLKAHHVVMLFRKGSRTALDLRVQVFAVTGDLQQPRHVVDARDFPLHLIVIGHVQMLEQRGRANLHAVAQAHRFDARIALHGAGQHGHGVRVVQEPRVRADLLHVMGKVHHHGNGAQSTENAADAQRIGDGLPQTVLLRHLKIRYGAGLVQAHLDGVHHIIRTAKRRLAVFYAAVFFDIGFVAKVVVDGSEHEIAFFQPLRVNVVERNGAFSQRRRYHAVTQNIFGKNGRTGTHESNFRHRSPSSS